MVSTGAFIGIIVTLIVTFLGPIVAIIVYSVKHKGMGVWKAWFLGAAGFVLLQMLIRVPVLSVLGMFPWFQSFAERYYLVYCLILAMTAALFEVVARFAVAKLLQKKMNYQQGVAAGLGHGGIEAMLLVGMTYVSNLLFAVMINSGAFDTLYDPTMISFGAEGTLNAQLYQIKTALIETPAYAFYLAGYERILCVLFHTAMSLLVCCMVYKKKALLGVGIAFVAHFAVDFVSPVINGLATPYLGNVISRETAYVLVYGILTAVAVGAVVVICKMGKRWNSDTVSL